MGNKKKGAYYTPPKLAEWLVSYIAESNSHRSFKNVLEPSCGDGVFIEKLQLNHAFENSKFVAVDIDPIAIKKIRKKNLKCAHIHNANFLNLKINEYFDLIIGNPPYISRKLLNNDQKSDCLVIHNKFGFKDTHIWNIWTAFLIKSISLLNKNGIIAFILPYETLNTNYASGLRDKLEELFVRIEIFTFRNITFVDTEQETIILICYTEHKESKGVFFGSYKNVNELFLQKKITFNKKVNFLSKKWNNILSNSEIDFLNNISEKFVKIKEISSSSAGIVTAANSYFIITKKKAIDLGVLKYCKPIIKKSSFISSSMVFNDKDFDELSKSDFPCFLLDLNRIKEIEFSKKLKEYLRRGEDDGLQRRYKMLQRNRWYDVPSIWSSRYYFFKRSHFFPKLIWNKADALVTDSAYRINLIPPYDTFDLLDCFYNSFTLAMIEVCGRRYGGGVLELTPNEFKNIPVPYLPKISNALNSNNCVVPSADYIGKTNSKYLGAGLGISETDINKINMIYEKLKYHRLKG